MSLSTLVSLTVFASGGAARNCCDQCSILFQYYSLGSLVVSDAGMPCSCMLGFATHF